MMVIRTNVTALRTLGQSRKQQTAITKSLEKLSSGFRINRAADDAAGLGVSESMRAQITELERCQQNVNEGLDVTNTADGALEEINNMLCRAHELCIQAANGIYDDADKDAISMEMNQLFDEIDRITAATRHNDIQLFRYTGPKMPKEIHYEYDETFTEIDPLNPANWGQMDFVQDAQFDPPATATPATVTMTFDRSVDMNDAMTLKGKSVTIGGRNFNFTDGTDSFPEGGTFVYVSAGQTVQAAMTNLVNSYNNSYYTNYKLESATVNSSNRTVTFEAKLRDLTESIVIDGKTVTSAATDGNGEYANGLIIGSHDRASIAQVDGSDATNNKPVYASTATVSLELSARTLTADDVKNLDGNTLHVCGKSIALKNLFTVGMTQDEVGAKLAAEISALNNLDAQYADGKLTVTASGLSTTAPANLDIYEEKTESKDDSKDGVIVTGTALPLSPQKTGNATDNGTPFTGDKLTIKCDVTTPASLETAEVAKITLPTSYSSAFGFQTSSGRTFFFYDSSDPAFNMDEYPKLSCNISNTVDTKGMSQSQIMDKVITAIKGDISGAVVTVNGNEMTIESTSINKHMDLSRIQGISVTATPYKQKNETWELNLPASYTAPFSFQTSNSKKYFFYDSSKTDFKTDEYDKMRYEPRDGVTAVDIKGYSASQIQDKIASCIRNDYTGTATVTQNGSKLTIEAKSVGFSLYLSSYIKGLSIKATSYKTETHSGTNYILGQMNMGTKSYPKYLTQEVGYPIHLGASLDISKLAGSGFSLNGKSFEFVKGSGVRTDYTDVNIAGAASFEDVRSALADAMGANYKVALDDSDPDDVQLKITVKKTTTNTSVSFSDGYHDTDGIFTNSGDAALNKQFSGGVNTGHSQKIIDFSSINNDNLESLLGKGFRITCATCTGEYINVFFCWENDGTIPESFDVVDDVSGKTRTIHNIAVELSKVSSGDQIVRDIVEQVRPSLEHYTDVAVGNPPTQLVAMDKRLGDVTDGTTIYRAQILSGLSTNFIYNVVKREVEDNPPVKTSSDQVTVDYRMMYIYAGSHPEAQFIPIHLPYLDLETLNLRPPWVDMKNQDPSKWLSRVDAANNAISSSRGRIGADHNRLEHAENVLIATAENVTASESRIRDADMAKIMAEQVKLSILGQAQMSMLAQANTEPQKVLELLK